MEVKTIKIPEIAKKPFQVLTTNRNIMRMQQYQLAVLKVGEGVDEEDVAGQTQASLAVLEEMLSFIRVILNLDDEAYEKLLDMPNDRTQEVVNKLVGYLYGLSDEDMAEADVENPKEEAQASKFLSLKIKLKT